MIKEIIKLADHLDMIGEESESDLLDNLLPHIYQVISEEHHDEDDGHHEFHHEDNYMVFPQLMSISEKAATIAKLCHSGAELDDWMETYIAQADIMIDNIYDKLMVDVKHPGTIHDCGCSGECECDG